MIDITNGRECMKSFVMHLPLCIQSYHFHSSLSMQVLSIQGMLKPTLSIDWGDLIIFSETNETLSLTLPSTIPVSMYTAYKIRKTFKRGLPLITQLWACHQSFGMPIKYCDSSCPLQNINTSNGPDQSKMYSYRFLLVSNMSYCTRANSQEVIDLLLSQQIETFNLQSRSHTNVSKCRTKVNH